MEPCVHLRRDPHQPHQIHVELTQVADLSRYSSVELHLVLYPYSESVDASGLEFLPYEEYVGDISDQQSSAYSEPPSPADHLFGIMLAFLTIGLIATFSSTELFRVEALVRHP